MKNITQKMSDAYANGRGTKCPHCGSENISAGATDADGTAELYQRVECLACGEEWDEIYRLVGATNV